MRTAEAGTRISIKNVLFLTDFSQSSEAALPFAISIAREFGATVHALHVLIPKAITVPEAGAWIVEAEDETAKAEMARVEAELTGVPHEISIVRDSSIRSAVESQIVACNADLIVLGTHGRTGAKKLLLGSVAEEMFRGANVPVLTIGPKVSTGFHSGSRFRRVLFATDFTPESLEAAPYALSLAEEHEGRLLLLHVLPEPERREGVGRFAASVADAMHTLHQLVPKGAEAWCSPQAVVEHGDPAERILWVASEREVDLIVLSVRGRRVHLEAATHIGKTIAQKIVSHAKCPVLTVRV